MNDAQYRLLYVHSAADRPLTTVQAMELAHLKPNATHDNIKPLVIEGLLTPHTPQKGRQITISGRLAWAKEHYRRQRMVLEVDSSGKIKEPKPWPGEVD